MHNIWKWAGLAGLVGVAAGGVLVARDHRKREAYTPDEIRSKLHQRLEEADKDCLEEADKDRLEEADKD